MGSADKGGFTAPPEQVTFDGLLFDMDGTIIDSTDAVVKHWHTYVNERECAGFPSVSTG